MSFRRVHFQVLEQSQRRRLVSVVVALAMALSMSQWNMTVAQAARAPLASSIVAAPVGVVAVSEPEPVSSRPDLVSAAVSARGQGSRVEAESERSATASTWANPDGTLTSEVHAGPIRFRDAGGAWQDVDLTLVERPDGSVAPRGHPGGLRLKGATRTASLAVPTATENDVVSTVEGVDGSGGVSLAWMGALGRPTLAGNRATYVDVQPGVDLVVEVLRTGYEQSLVIKSAAALAGVSGGGADVSWSLPVNTRGLTARSETDGSVSFVDAKDVVASRLAAPMAWDAGVDPRSGEHTSTAAVKLTVAQAGRGRAVVTMTPDQGWLADPSRLFPITIDPTYVSVNVTTSFDTYVSSMYPTATYSTAAELRVGTYNGGGDVYRSFLSFPLASIKGKDIVSASLSLYEFYSYSCTARLFSVYNAYTADSLTKWSNQPTAFSYYGGLTTAKGYSSSCAAGRVSVPVTGLVSAWSGSASTSAGIRLHAPEDDSYGWKKFYSLESGQDPYVTFTYNRPPNTPGAPTHTPGTSSGTGTTGWTTTTTPTLKATVSDPDGDTVKALFKVYLNGTGTPVVDLAGTTVASGGVSTLVVPAGKLVNGSQYIVRAYGNDGSLTSVGAPPLYDRVTVDTTAPNAPTVTSTTWTAGATSAATSGTISWSDTSTDVASYAWKLDAGAWSAPTTATSRALSGLLSGAHTFSVRATDLATHVSATTNFTFTVDAIAPTAPTVTSTTFPENQWSTVLGADGKAHFTAKATTADSAKVQWSLDSTTYAASATVAGTATIVDIALSAPAAGKHTLNVRSLDTATNASPAKAYTFYYGAGVAVAQPLDNQVTARRLPLQLSVDPALVPSLGSPSYEYRRGAADLLWKTVSLTEGDVTTPAGAAVSVWPAQADSTTVLYWDAATALGGNGGVIEVRAAFSTGAPATDPVTATVDVNGGQAEEASIGPASVNLLTGELSLTTQDASIFGASIGRSYESRSINPAAELDTSSAFGPAWTLTGESEGLVDWQAVYKTSDTSVELTDATGSVTGFTRDAVSPTSWTPQPGSEGLTLLGDASSATATFTLTDHDGNITTFAKPTGGATAPPNTWPVTAATSPGDRTSTGYGFDTDAQGKLRLKRVAASNPALTDTQLVGCADPTTVLSSVGARGCRVLELEWGTPAGTSVTRVVSTAAWAWDPQTNGMTQTTEATYGYDSTGRLTSVTDPKPGLVPGGSPLTTAYTYNSDGRVASVTPPGEQPWNFGYATGSVVAGASWDRSLATSVGRAVTVSRANLQPGSLTETSGTTTSAIVYGVPTTTTLGPVGVDLAATQTWGQGVAPVEGTAVFDADAPAQPANDNWAGDDVTKRSWANAYVTYMDVNGRETNHLSRDGMMDAIDRNASGDTTFELSAGNRAISLGQGSGALETLAELGLTGETTAARAEALATITGYESGADDASRVAWEQGPLHTVVAAQGEQAHHRATTRFDYDSGQPADSAVEDLATTSSTGGLPRGADPATAPLDNPRTVTTSFDWTVGQATAVTTDPSPSAGDEIMVRSTLDTQGRLKSQAQPSNSPAGTRTITYWEEASGPCSGHPEWGGLVCTTGQAGAITGSTSNTDLPSTTLTAFSRTGATLATSQSANGATRATAISLDQAGRTKTITKTAAGLGNAPAAQTITYDSATGRIASTTASGQTIATTTDTLGRPVSYTESNGLRETTTYDSQSRPMTLTQVDTAPGGLPGSFTTDMTYDPVTSRLATQTDSQAGTTTLGYDIAGNITSQVRSGAPGQLTTTSRFDVLGAEVERAWSMNGQAGPVLSESAISNIHGQQVDHTMMPGGHRDYGYDGTGRLTSVTDLDAGACAVRAYRFDVNSNRTGHTTTSAPATSDGSGDLTVCPSATTPPTSSVFDSGDRIIDDGYAYDEFGRTARLPLSDGQVMRVEYNADDLVAAQHVYANAQDADAAGGGTNAISTSTYTLDATGQRFATRSASAQDGTSITRTLRYDDESDSPAWTDEGDGTITRYIHGPGGGLAATASIDKANPSGGAELVWQIANMHGDISATLPASASTANQVSRPDEYGAGTEQPRYGWLGSQQRAGDTPAGAYLMGVRLYNPDTGRFLSTDPVHGGNANAYAYPTDPVGDLDLDGRASYPKYSWALCHWWQVGCGASRKAYASALGWGKEKMARAAGARCFSEGGLRICENTPRWVGVARIGTTWGTTFLVAARLTPVLSRRSRLIRHEKEHVRQWQLFGAKFAYLYAGEGLFNGCGNYFEQKAGLADGGYAC